MFCDQRLSFWGRYEYIVSDIDSPSCWSSGIVARIEEVKSSYLVVKVNEVINKVHLEPSIPRAYVVEVRSELAVWNVEKLHVDLKQVN